MASDDLRARIAEALRLRLSPVHAPGSVLAPEAAIDYIGLTEFDLADAVMTVVGPELDRRDRRIEEYRESRERWMASAYADRRASESVGEQLRAALTALQAVREAQSLGEALAAVAKHDGLTIEELS